MPARVPMANVVSIGDVLIVIGMVAFVYRSCTDLPALAPTCCEPLRSRRFRRVMAGPDDVELGDWLTQAAIVTWIYAEHALDHRGRRLSDDADGRRDALGGIISAPMLDRLAGFRALSVVELCAAAARSR